jgi:peroxiredoxin
VFPSAAKGSPLAIRRWGTSVPAKMIWLLALGATWIALSQVPAEMAAVRADPPPLPRRGFTAPDFSLETLDGQTIALSDLRGQVLLINFWASWCLPCREEMPAIQQVYERYRDQDFVVLAVNLQEQDAQVTAFTDRLELTFPVLIDRDGSVFDRYRVMALPSTAHKWFTSPAPVPGWQLASPRRGLYGARGP